jgi:hypothetical protein
MAVSLFSNYCAIERRGNPLPNPCADVSDATASESLTAMETDNPHIVAASCPDGGSVRHLWIKNHSPLNF